uniref:L1 transposable element RRM domain-containing protein n=1 Tax=Oryzias sinensis TaxID=183150 RepID=A0A8C7YNH5_9TELE
MPKVQEKNSSASKTSNAAEQQANLNDDANVTPSHLLRAIETLKFELKEDNDSIRKDINSSRQEMRSKLDNISKEMQGLTERVDEAETRVGQVEEVSTELTRTLLQLIKRQRITQTKLTDLESRSRRNNIRLFGVEEGAEEKSVLQFITDLIRRELLLPSDLDLKIQRAHRTPTRKPGPNAPPRPIIINFQEFTTKELVLRQAWKKGRIQMKDRSIYFDHDYAPEIVQKRKEYQAVKRALKSSGIRFQTPYTSMRIHWRDGVQVYSSAHAAGLELRRRGFDVEVPVSTAEEEAGESRLQEILGWQQAAPPPPESRPSTRQRVKEKLREFARNEDK